MIIHLRVLFYCTFALLLRWIRVSCSAEHEEAYAASTAPPFFEKVDEKLFAV